jgi:uncharacterized protein YbaP (TraB family)
MRNALVAFAILLVAGVAHGDDEPAMIWIITGDTNNIYLLGSIHVLRESDHPLPEILEMIYDDAEQLVMEIDMDDVDPVSTMRFLTSHGVLKGDRTLQDVMGPEMYAAAEASAAAVDIPLEMLAKTEPWLAAITVEEMVMNRAGFNAAHGIEMYLTNKAVADGKIITGLETIEEQLGFLDGLSIDTQNRWLLQSISEAERTEKIIIELVAAWRRGDAAFLEEILLSEFDEYPELHDLILINRNKKWVGPIMALLNQDDDYLIVVGAAHLVGEESVPDLLSKQGVRIRQLHESFQ